MTAAGAAIRLTLVCQGATDATRGAAFPQDAMPLDPRAAAALPQLRAALGWRERALAAPSRAARDTAAALAPEVVPEPALRECDYGRWTGRPMTIVESDHPDDFARWLGDPAAAPHGGEALTDVLGRTRAWLDREAATPGNRLAVVSPFIVRALVVEALDLPASVFWRLDVAPLSLTRLTAQGGRWRLAAFNAMQ